MIGRRVVFSLLVSLVGVLLLGCGNKSSSTTASASSELTVAAAADLQNAFSDIARLFEEENGCRVVLSFGSTGQLAKQIEHGAPIDLFAAADVTHIDSLRAKNLIIADSQQLYGRGRIVLAVNEKSGVRATQLEDLLGADIKYVAIANPGHAPYGVAAKQALEHQGLWGALEPKLVFGENVRQSMQYVQTGNAEAGIVALSVAQLPGVQYTLIDESWYAPLNQAIAVVAGTKQENLARQFIRFLNGPEGRPIMKNYGFLLPEEIQFDERTH